MNRRRFLAAGALACVNPRAGATIVYPAVTPRALAFPRDHGSHPDFRTEWWYLTGWVRDDEGERGVQVTFFRSRPGVAEALRSAFAPKQILFAHAALADARIGRLLHDQRAARAFPGLAEAAEATTAVQLDRWSLVLDGDTYRARIPAREFTFDLAFEAVAPLLPQGVDGMSRKGPLPAQSSYYYSRPQIRITGRIAQGGRDKPVEGVAWLDHEWSSEYLAPQAQGWDWTGVNLEDGGALMAFRIRDAQGGTLWAGGTRREADGRTERYGPADIAFDAVRSWRSPRTGVTYPVQMRLRTGASTTTLTPLFDDQELDARATVGTVYWEGAVRAAAPLAGRGYLELTGYEAPLKL